MRREWDAIVVGASFAGLAAAMELRGRGRVLVLDKDPVGEHQTSACGTPLAVLERLQATAALEQVHEELVFHLPGGRVRRYRPAYAYATFDYRGFCRILAARTDAEIVQARVLGREAGRVRTSLGDFEATILIDASGWRSVLAARPAARGASAGPRTVGLEVALPRRGNGLHFWLGDELARDGYLWDFPAEGTSRIGLIRYRSGGGLKARLERFIDEPVTPDRTHGGVLPAGLREPVADGVFLTGDAAGLCLPLTGEGIRPALVFGQLAGRLGARVLDGDLPLPDALATYRRRATNRRLAVTYRVLATVERSLHRLPGPLLDATSWYFGGSPFAARCQTAYWRVAPAEWLRPGPAVATRSLTAG